MSDDLPDLSEFDKYLDDEDLEKLKAERGTTSKGSTKGGGSGRSEASAGAPKRGARRGLWLLVGVAVGVAGTLFLPDLARPYLPSVLRPGSTDVPGLVLDKRTEGERLLLTVDTDRGATLATFTRRVPEIDLLVSEGDSVTLGLGSYAPLIEDPALVGVRKGRGAPAGGEGRPGESETTTPADTGSLPSAGPDEAPSAAPDTAGSEGPASAPDTVGR